MIEAEAKHIQAQELLVTTAQVKLLKRGQMFAFVVAIGSLGGAAYAVQYSATVAGLIASLGLGTLAVAFLGRSQRKDKASKGGDEPASS